MTCEQLFARYERGKTRDEVNHYWERLSGLTAGLRHHPKMPNSKLISRDVADNVSTSSKFLQAEPLIELKGVSKSFGSSVVLDEVDLKLYRGEALAIIGPSGTGKSTILRIIAGLLAPDAGEIYIQGQRRQGLIEDAKDPIKIGMLFQQEAHFDTNSISSCIE